MPTQPPPGPADNQPRGPGPLERRLRAAAARGRADFAPPQFARDDYAMLAGRAGALADGLAARGLSDAAVESVREHGRVLASVVRLLDDPGAAVAAPSNDAVYRAGLVVARLQRAVAQLAGAPAAWNDALDALLTEDDPATAARRMTNVEFAGVCRAARIPCRPLAGPAAASVEIDEWTLAAAADVADEPAGLAPAARRACDTLRALKRPGLIVLDAGGAIPDAPSLRRVGSDATAMIEMRCVVDQFIVDRHDELTAAVDTDFAFGAVVSVVLHSMNVSSGRLVFASSTRAFNLCEPDDARAPRLAAFMSRLGP
jgi:hypothetical protein